MSKDKNYEKIPFEFVIASINTESVQNLLKIGKIVCSTDYAVRHYYNRRSRIYHLNREALRKSIRRCYTIGAFNHRKTIIEELRLNEKYEGYLKKE